MLLKEYLNWSSFLKMDQMPAIEKRMLTFSFWTTSMFVRKVYKMVHLCKICMELALPYCESSIFLMHFQLNVVVVYCIQLSDIHFFLFLFSAQSGISIIEIIEMEDDDEPVDGCVESITKCKVVFFLHHMVVSNVNVCV